jgi:hypothetical protein
MWLVINTHQHGNESSHAIKGRQFHGWLIHYQALKKDCSTELSCWLVPKTMSWCNSYKYWSLCFLWTHQQSNKWSCMWCHHGWFGLRLWVGQWMSGTPNTRWGLLEHICRRYSAGRQGEYQITAGKEVYRNERTVVTTCIITFNINRFCILTTKGTGLFITILTTNGHYLPKQD